MLSFGTVEDVEDGVNAEEEEDADVDGNYLIELGIAFQIHILPLLTG